MTDVAHGVAVCVSCRSASACNRRNRARLAAARLETAARRRLHRAAPPSRTRPRMPASEGVARRAGRRSPRSRRAGWLPFSVPHGSVRLVSGPLAVTRMEQNSLPRPLRALAVAVRAKASRSLCRIPPHTSPNRAPTPGRRSRRAPRSSAPDRPHPLPGRPRNGGNRREPRCERLAGRLGGLLQLQQVRPRRLRVHVVPGVTGDTPPQSSMPASTRRASAPGRRFGGGLDAGFPAPGGSRAAAMVPQVVLQRRLGRRPPSAWPGLARKFCTNHFLDVARGGRPDRGWRAATRCARAGSSPIPMRIPVVNGTASSPACLQGREPYRGVLVRRAVNAAPSFPHNRRDVDSSMIPADTETSRSRASSSRRITPGVGRGAGGRSPRASAARPGPGSRWWNPKPHLHQRIARRPVPPLGAGHPA